MLSTQAYPGLSSCVQNSESLWLVPAEHAVWSESATPPASHFLKEDLDNNKVC